MPPSSTAPTSPSDAWSTSEEVRNLPIHLGDVDNIIRLGNGVAFTDEPAKDQPWQPLNTAYAMAGSPSSRNEFTLDGASNTFHDEARSAVGQAWTPIADVVAEFKVQTATFDVSTGSTEGGVVNVSLKSGTNKIHGSAFFNKETAKLDANSFFANAAGTPRANLNLTNPGGTINAVGDRGQDDLGAAAFQEIDLALATHHHQDFQSGGGRLLRDAVSRIQSPPNMTTVL